LMNLAWIHVLSHW